MLMVAYRRGIDWFRIFAKTNKRQIVDTRGFIALLAHDKGYKLIEIAGYFEKSHAGVLHNIRNIESLANVSKQIKRELDEYKERIAEYEETNNFNKLFK